MAGAIRAQPFGLVLDRIGSFRHARIAWIGAANPPVALLELQRRLAEGLRAAGFALEERPYSPHVTLARRIERAPRLEVEAIEWPAREFTLVRSQAGRAAYTRLADWRLG